MEVSSGQREAGGGCKADGTQARMEAQWRTAVPPVLKKSASTGSWHDCASLMKKVSFSWRRSGS